MDSWHKMTQNIIREVDQCIRQKRSDEISLELLAQKFGYSESHFSRKFREISGMQFRDYLRLRKLTFAAKQLRDTDESILEIAVNYGFSSHEAFTRAFRETYGITPSAYRRTKIPLVLRTALNPFDCYLLETGNFDTRDTSTNIKTYFITIPAHKFLHIRNYESIGYWDFWQKQSQIPGQDCETICGLLDSIPSKLDDLGGSGADSGSGQIMAFLNEPTGRVCSWGIPLAECYGVRLPADYTEPIPNGMILTDIAEGEYIVFEHGPFDFERENQAVEEKIERAMKNYDYSASGYQLDTTPGRIFYFYHDCARFWKYVRPVKRA